MERHTTPRDSPPPRGKSIATTLDGANPSAPEANSTTEGEQKVAMTNSNVDSRKWNNDLIAKKKKNMTSGLPRRVLQSQKHDCHVGNSENR